VVITTPGGLYRYDIGDEVNCVGFYKGAPRLQFVGRANLVSDMVGEKLSEAFVSRVLCGMNVLAMLVPQQHPHPHYELWIDDWGGGHMGNIAIKVDQGLRANPQYNYARELGQLREVRVVISPGVSQYRYRALADRGQRIGDIKQTVLLIDRSLLPKNAARILE
jgi:hypothetical protein